MLAVAVLNTVKLPHQSRWLAAIRDVMYSGLRSLSIAKKPIASGFFAISPSLETAIVKVALKAPGCEESLKAAPTDDVQSIPGWRGSLAGDLLEETLPGWRKLFDTFTIESLSRSHHVETMASIMCMLPPDEDCGKGNNKKRNKRKNEQKRQRNEVVGKIFEDFMEGARTLLEEAYDKKSGTSTGDI